MGVLNCQLFELKTSVLNSVDESDDMLLQKLSCQRFLPEVNFGFTSPNGDGCVFLGGVDGDRFIGAHLLRFGVV